MLVQLGFYFHMRQYMGDHRVILTRPLLFTVSFMLFFSIVIALFKDIPDVKGDSQVVPPRTLLFYVSDVLNQPAEMSMSSLPSLDRRFSPASGIFQVQ